jgi:hypothetical protein
MSVAGWIPKRVATTAHYLNQFMPLWAVYCLGGIVFFGGLLFIVSFIPVGSPPSAAVQKAAHEAVESNRKRSVVLDTKPIEIGTRKSNTANEVKEGSPAVRRRKRD